MKTVRNTLMFFAIATAALAAQAEAVVSGKHCGTDTVQAKVGKVAPRVGSNQTEVTLIGAESNKVVGREMVAKRKGVYPGYLQDIEVGQVVCHPTN